LTATPSLVTSRELGAVPARFISAPGAPISVAEDTAPAGVVVPAVGAVVPVMTPFERLRRFITRNIRRRGFIELRTPGLSRLRFKLLKLRAMRSKGAHVLVYVGEHDGAKEYWFPSDQFAEIAGGASEASALKKDVDRRGLLETTRRGRRKVSYVVKRPLPDGSRPFFVVIRHHPKKSPGRGHALAAAAPA
jgi:hypothetical protein